MKNVKIAGKLSIAFAIAIMGLVGLGVFSIQTASTLAESAHYLGVDEAKKVTVQGELNGLVSDYRALQATHILTLDTPGMQKLANSMDGYRTQIDQHIQFLDANLNTPSGREVLGRLKGDWTTFVNHTLLTRALSEKNANVEAANSFRSEAPAYDRLNSETDQMFEVQKVEAAEAVKASEATYNSARFWLILVIIAVVALLCTLLFLLVRSIAKPLGAVTVGLGELAQGKLDVAIPAQTGRDEVGSLVTAMGGLRDQLLAAERAKTEQTMLIVDSIGQGLDALSRGDMTARVDADLTGPFAKLKADFNNAMTEMANALGAVAEATGGISNGASDIRQASDDLAQRTEQQAASLEQTAAAMQEITSTVKETAVSATRVNGVVNETRTEAEHSGEVVRRAVDAMSGIERGSNEISEIITVIDGIAFQTNLLALNAGVEAARAGDAGRGFAVVASEVRALAQRSAEAAKDVKTRILASSEQVDAGVDLVSETGKALQRIIARIGEISTLVSSIAGSAEQQSTGLQQINTAVSEMDGVTQQNAAMVEEATAAARSLSSEAEELARQVARFNLGVTEDRPARSPSVVHRLQDRAAQAGRRIARAPRKGGSAAVAVAEDDWSAF